MPAERLQEVPDDSLGLVDGLIRAYLGLAEGEDPFIAGALWASAVELDVLFGTALPEDLLQDLFDLEVYNGGQWVPLPPS